MQKRSSAAASTSSAAVKAYTCAPPGTQTVVQSLEHLVWMMLGAAALFYGNGEKDAIDIVRNDERILQPFINIAATCAILNAACFLYVFVYLEKVKGLENPQNSEGRAFVAVGAVTMVAGGVSLTVGIWPVWGILAPILVFVLFMGFIMSLQYLPTFGILRVKPVVKDATKQK